MICLKNRCVGKGHPCFITFEAGATHDGVASALALVDVASNGMFYWMHTRTFLKAKTFYPERLRPYEIPWIRAVDVNTPEDYDMLLELAPWILKMAPVSGRQP